MQLNESRLLTLNENKGLHWKLWKEEKVKGNDAIILQIQEIKLYYIKSR